MVTVAKTCCHFGPRNNVGNQVWFPSRNSSIFPYYPCIPLLDMTTLQGLGAALKVLTIVYLLILTKIGKVSSWVYGLSEDGWIFQRENGLSRGTGWRLLEKELHRQKSDHGRDFWAG